MEQSIPEFYRFMLGIANDLNEADREKLGYYLRDKIPAGKREALRKRPAICLFEELQRAELIVPGNLGFLKESLRAISRNDLANKVEKFDRDSNSLRLMPKDVNCVESSGYGLGIPGGKHLVNNEGEDYVYLPSGENYQLDIWNMNDHRVKCEVKCDGHIIFPGLIIEAGKEASLDRPCHTASKLKFFAVKDAPADSGIDARNTENGVIQVTFIPEISKITITCDIGEGRSYPLTCRSNTTDVEFYSLISSKFYCNTATVLVDCWKPLPKRNMKLEDYGINNGSRVFVNFGLVGGVNAPPFELSWSDDEDDLESVKWIPGATTMQGRSWQTFVNVNNFVPNNEMRKVVLHLRLVAREDEPPVASNGMCTPFVLGNRYPPPV